MKINKVIVSTDSNPLYYKFWPLCADAWRNIHIEPVLAAVGEVKVDSSKGTIVCIEELANVPSGFISQVIRFIIPCFYPDEVSVIGDIDMIPLSRSYFTKNISNYSDDDIIIFSSDAYPEQIRFPMCYIAAKGKYFQEIIGLQNTEPNTISNFIKFLYDQGLGWDTDELFFAHKLMNSKFRDHVKFLKRGWTPLAKYRIDRVNWRYKRIDLISNKYIDAHSLRPLDENLEQLKDLHDYINCGSNGFKYLLFLVKKSFIAKASCNISIANNSVEKK